uniref:Uncharacterized protein n=1 Tax=Kwoniella bestiolae CBS 10118 TaxID=1296100 RepID=A0A1B9FZQ7_9TREE|nr:hypothetical protein I302_05709 [Kwoniella bestiolae CBS 10118]OCF24250.1 hypothetical protein I302_05709 [Kwoniella bestiolae CBS 10118]
MLLEKKTTTLANPSSGDELSQSPVCSPQRSAALSKPGQDNWTTWFATLTDKGGRQEAIDALVKDTLRDAKTNASKEGEAGLIQVGEHASSERAFGIAFSQRQGFDFSGDSKSATVSIVEGGTRVSEPMHRMTGSAWNHLQLNISYDFKHTDPDFDGIVVTGLEDALRDIDEMDVWKERTHFHFLDPLQWLTNDGQIQRDNLKCSLQGVGLIKFQGEKEVSRPENVSAIIYGGTTLKSARPAVVDSEQISSGSQCSSPIGDFATNGFAL